MAGIVGAAAGRPSRARDVRGYHLGMSLLIRGGRLIEPGRNLDQTADILIDGGLVRAIETTPGTLTAPAGGVTIDAEGCIVTPGLIDPHVHFRDPGPDHEETIATGADSAIHGGFTTVACMPNTSPPLDTPEQIAGVHERGRAAGACRVFAVGCATVGRRGE